MILTIIVGLIVLFMFLNYYARKRNNPSSLKVAETIERFINGTGATWEWDDFISVPIKDPELDKIRSNCSRLPEEYPPTRKGEYTSERGVDVLKGYIKQLRDRGTKLP